MIRRGVSICAGLLVFVVTALVPLASWAGGPEGELHYKASTDGVTGLNLVLVNMYNDQRLLYAVITTGAMAVMGIIIGVTVDFCLVRIGLGVTKVEHKE